MKLIKPYITTHDSIPAETGKNDGDKTSGECISRQVVAKFLDDWLFCLDENCHKQSASDLKMIIKDFKNLPSAQPETNCSEIPNNSDATSKQAAIESEAISKWKKEFREYVDSLDVARDDWKGIIEYIEELPSVQPEQRWVPCSERQPDASGWYITTISGEICGQDRAFSGMSEFANGKWMSGDDVDETEMTIAWMPLPEYYQEGGDT